MALLDAYATRAEYRARTGSKAAAGADTTLDEQLLAASRLIELEMGLAPGGFNASAANAQRFFDGNGGDLLRLRDRQGLMNPITTIDSGGIGVDTTGDGTLDTTFDLSDAWVAGDPYNAAELVVPFTGLLLLPIGGATASVGQILQLWPTGLAHNIGITGTWGYTAVPNIVIDLVSNLVHDMRQSGLAGMLREMPAIDESLPLTDQTWRIWLSAKQRFGHRIPGIA